MLEADVARFWSKVDKTETCWLWTGNIRGGYGRFKSGEKVYSAHRFAWELEHGPLADDEILDHKGCGVRRCVRHHHLEKVTLAQNTARSNMTRGWNCGHPKVEVNIYRTRDGLEGCVTCRVTRRRRRREHRGPR